VVAGSKAQDDDDRVLDEVNPLDETGRLIQGPMPAAQRRARHGDRGHPLGSVGERDVAAGLGGSELAGKVGVPAAQAGGRPGEQRRCGDGIRHRRRYWLSADPLGSGHA
jgi:hypothetical protein